MVRAKAVVRAVVVRVCTMSLCGMVMKDLCRDRKYAVAQINMQTMARGDAERATTSYGASTTSKNLLSQAAARPWHGDGEYDAKNEANSSMMIRGKP